MGVSQGLDNILTLNSKRDVDTWLAENSKWGSQNCDSYQSPLAGRSNGNKLAQSLSELPPKSVIKQPW